MRVRFDEFVFDSEQRELCRAGVRVHISPKAVVLLDALLSERPRVIAKPELQSRIWPDVVVEEANLTNLVSELRAALGDDPRHPRYVRTAHGFGYAFSGDAVDEAGNGAHKSLRIVARAALVMLMSAAGLIFFLRMRKPDVRGAALPARAVTVQRLSIDSLGSVAVSPDRRFLAYSTIGLAHSSIRLRQLDTGAEFDLVSADDALYLGHLKFSPDGNWLYYLRSETARDAYDELRRIPILGGAPEVIVRRPEELGVAYAVSPDATGIAFIRHARDSERFTVVAANADGTNQRDLASFRQPEGLCCSMSWSPDRTRLLLPLFPFEGQPQEPQFNLAIIDVGSGTVQRLLPYAPLQAVVFADWTPDNRGFVAAENDSTLHYFSFPGLRESRIDAPSALYSAVFALADATLLALSAKGQSSLWTVDLDRPQAVINQITGGEGTGDGWDGVTWTPDGQIVYSAEDLAAQSQSLRICDADGSHVRQLTRAAANVYHSYPAVSPDGTVIVFTESHGNAQRMVSARIVRMRMDGGDITQVSEPSRFMTQAYFADGGRAIVFTQEGGLMKVPAEGKAVPFGPQRRRECNAPGLDPTGTWVACATNGKEPGYVVALDGGRVRPQKETSHVRVFRWTADGALSYVKGPPANIFVQPVDGKPEQVTNFGSGRIMNFAWSARGRKIAIAREWTLFQAYILRNVPLPDQSR